MARTVREKADIVATFRFVCVHLMETLARWVPTTPEMEVKALFGRHIWELAQHADMLGKRSFELRAPLHHDRRPVEAYAEALETLRATADTGGRIAAFYDAALPDLDRRYRAILEIADPLLDHPTSRLLDRMVADLARMASERQAMREESLEAPPEDGRLVPNLRRAFASTERIADYRAAAGVAATP